MRLLPRSRLGLGAVLLLLAVGAFVLALTVRANSTARSAAIDDRVTLASFRSTDAAAIERGRYVMTASDCVACHTASKGVFAGGYEITTPFGKLLTSNITPDRATGIGDYTERDFFNALRHGQGKHGFLYPAMPYPAYAKLTDRDMHDLWAYMSTVRPVAQQINETAGLNFPFNIRLLMSGWNLLFFDNKGFSPDPSRDAQWNRGRYLVDGATHCATCHTPRNMLGGPILSRDMQGGVVDTWYAPNITNDPHVGLGRTSSADVARYLGTGSDGVAIAAGPMAEAVEKSTQFLTPSDRLAIATYLKSLPGKPEPVPAALAAADPRMQRGARGYEVHCAACHGSDGRGVPDMITGFAGNHALLDRDTTSALHALLVGSRAVHTQALPTAAGMPAFDWKLQDRQIADILTYVRNTWGNAAPPVEAKEVAQMREQLHARSPLPRAPAGR
jgi:mono/diheme cytochrome c family protein